MFGLGFTEVLVLLIVGIVVVGPKKLPVMMRTAGQWITKLRRMSTDLRSQSGIDEIIRAEGLEKEIRELKSLSRINVMDSLVNASTARPAPRSLTAKATAGGASSSPSLTTGVAPAPAISAGAGAIPATSSTTASSAAGGSATTSDPTVATASRLGPEAAEPARVLPPGAPPRGAIAARSPLGAPPVGFGARRAVAMVPLPGEEPLPDREWPMIGCDAYDALPDDLDEQEASAATEVAAVRTDGPEADAPVAPAAEGSPAVERPPISAAPAETGPA